MSRKFDRFLDHQQASSRNFSAGLNLENLLFNHVELNVFINRNSFLISVVFI